MPGYVLVHMEMSDESYHLINSINRVTGFLGPQGRPMPMRDAEVNAILNRVEEGQDAPRTLIHFEVGEKVASTTARSKTSTAWSRKWTTTTSASRSRCRSSAGQPRSNWNSRRSRSLTRREGCPPVRGRVRGRPGGRGPPAGPR